jgi:hypothetical protein
MPVVSNTRLFNVRNSLDYYNPIKNVSNTLYYMFSAKNLPWANTLSPSPITDSVYETEIQIFDEMIFGKIITPSNVVQMVNRYDWTSGTVYSMYDDQDQNLFTEKFFVVSPESGNYHVFKCIDNAAGIPSTSQPLFSHTSASDQSYVTADGYKWKYMYTISSTNFNTFATTQYVPVTVNTSVTSAAVNGSINDILLISGANNFVSYSNGAFQQISIFGNTQKLALGSNSSPNNQFYTGSALYINTGTGAGQVRSIVDYTITSNQYIVTVNNAFSPQPDLTSQYSISPSVNILGDGTGAAAAIAINSMSAAVTGITVVNVGSNYSYANVQIVGNTGGLAMSNAVARAIISPRGGHGANVASELNADKVGISITFANTDNISMQNEYGRIGILKAPLLANVVLQFSNATGAFTAGELVTQTVNSTYGATGTVVTSNTTKAYITSVSGQFVTSNLISGGTSGFTANVTSVTGPYTTFNQTLKLTGSYVGGANTFVLNDFCEQGIPGNGGAFGYVQGIDAPVGGGNTTYNIYLTGVKGTFQTGINTLQSADASKKFSISAIQQADLIKYTGNILYAENIISIQRSNTQSETVKLVLQFY